MKVCVHILALAALAGPLAASPARAGGCEFTTVNGPAPNVGGTHLVGISNSGLVADVTHDADYNV